MTLEFVDTNVVLYAYDGTAGKRHQRAVDVVSRLGEAHTGALSVQVLQEFYVNAVRKIAVPLRPEQARERMEAFDTWPTHAPGPHDVIAASHLSERYRVSFWDAMILRSAVVLGCRILWSEDLNAGQTIEGVTIRDPFAE